MTEYRNTRTDEEINRVLNWVAEGLDEGSHCPGASYEDGIHAALNWLFGFFEDAPDD